MRFKGDCEIYRAHFPDKPVTPGVCIMQMAREMAEEVAGRPMRIDTVRNIKFLAMLSPAATPEADFVVGLADNGCGQTACRVEVRDAERIYAKISMILRER